MKLQSSELEYLAAWSREEKAPDPYSLPAHQLQAIHQISGVTLIRLIKAWARAHGRRDEDIFNLFLGGNPAWPWPSEDALRQRVRVQDACAPSRDQVPSA